MTDPNIDLDAIRADQERINREQVKKFAQENPMVIPSSLVQLKRIMTGPLTPKPRNELPQVLDIDGIDASALIERLAAQHANYATTPFDPLGHKLRMYRNGVTIWSGFPGAGKTSLLRQFTCHLLKQGRSVFFAALEEQPDEALVRVAGASIGTSTPTAAELEDFMYAYSSKFRIWHSDGPATRRQMFNTIRALAQNGLQHAIIDSLACLDVANDDFEGQRQFVVYMVKVARECNVHIHLVAHPRKLVSADQKLDLNDVAGAREIGALADTVLFVQRQKIDTITPASHGQMCVGVRKQRHFEGWIGDIVGWYRTDYRQFHTDQFASRPIMYLPEAS